jgi:ubiquinone/menaquinone biosynthesis C-methylase UbiE
MPMPEDEKARVRSAYDHAADFYDHASLGFWDRFGRRTVERLGVTEGSLVLDLCCGAGASALPAASAVGRTGHVVAVDLSENLIRLGQAKARRLGLQNMDFRIADYLELDAEPDSFDCVVCVFGIFFVPDMASALKAMWSFVRPTGRLAVTTWGRDLFEPVNSMFGDAIRKIRPDLDKSFNAWERLGERRLVVDLFSKASVPLDNVSVEQGTHLLQHESDVFALLMGTGYRGVLERLTSVERTWVQERIATSVRDAGTSCVRTDVIYATCTK